MKILLAYDGSPSAEAAVDEVLRRPWPPASEVRLVTVIEPPVGVESANGEVLYAPLLERVRATMREEAFHRVQKALERFRGRSDLITSCEIREGMAKHAILDAIQEWGADLVVTGSNGARGIARLFLGSVSHALVTHAPCSVEVVRAQPPPDPGGRRERREG
jgi:nucleotide-binding universal stress UspA family protein